MSEGEHVRIRLWIEREQAGEEWIDCGDPGAAFTLGTRHIRLVAEANEAGRKWTIEIYDPDAPPDEAFMRFGTDQSMMNCPLPILGWDTADDGLPVPRIGTEVSPN